MLWFLNYWQTASPWSLIMWGLVAYLVFMALFVVGWSFFLRKEKE
jgi:hypothetical protein